MVKKYLLALFTGEANSALIQLFRYSLIGGLAFIFDFSALYVFHFMLGMNYLGSAALAFILGVATNYAISILWVFDKRAVKNQVIEFILFAMLGIIGLGITEMTLFLLTGCIGFHLMLSKAVATAITFGWNFGSRKLLLFTALPEGLLMTGEEVGSAYPIPLGADAAK